MKSIEVFVWAATEGLPSTSPFCLKVIYALRHKKLDHKVTTVARPPEWATRAKLPVIQIDGEHIEDSTTILKRLDELYPDTPRLYPLDNLERSDTLLLEDWSDRSLYWLFVYSRWMIDTNFENFAKVIFRDLPAPMREIIPPAARKNNQNRLEAIGITLLSTEERYDQVKEAVWCMEQRLKKHRFLVNQEITAADIAIFSVFQLIEKSQLVDLVNVFDEFPTVRKWMSELENIFLSESVLKPTTVKA